MNRLPPSRLALIAVAIVVAGSLAACGGSNQRVGVPDHRGDVTEYRVMATVLESHPWVPYSMSHPWVPGSRTPGHGPQLCWVLAMSLPPQCGGPDVVGWSWSRVAGEKSRIGTTWGRYVLVGTYDGARFTLTQPPRAQTAADQLPMPPTPDWSTPCPTPKGGWIPRARDVAYNRHRTIPTRYAERSPDVSAVWIDQTRQRGVLNVRYARHAATHARDLRARYAGNLCVTQGGRTRTQFREFSDTVLRSIPRPNQAWGLSNEIAGTVTIGVMVDPDGVLQQAVDARYGPGAVRIEPRMEQIH